MNETIQKPNAFAFKAFIDGEYRLCICPRIENVWSEKDIFYIPDDKSELSEYLEEQLFNIVFIGYEKDEAGGFWIKHQNSFFLKSDTVTSEELYCRGEFFTTVEKGYQSFYEQPERQGEQTTTGEEKSI